MAGNEDVCALGPVDPSSVPDAENERTASWVVRKLVGTITGRIVMASYESLRAAGTNVVCLSPWGDSSPLLLPCMRFRDLAVHTVIAATGGMAAVAAPVMGPVSDLVVSSLGDSITVEVGLHAGFKLASEGLNEVIIDHPITHLGPAHGGVLETTGVKKILITLKHKDTVHDAALSFFRSSVHRDASLFASMKDYLAVEKGWFSPYLFASGRRPIIPRTMRPDIVFCHGPFLAGDYKIGEALLAESAMSITLCVPASVADPAPTEAKVHHSSLSVSNMKLLDLKNMFARSRTPSPEPALAPPPPTVVPRRMVLLVLGLKPHRKLWTSSQRPGESVLYYQLLDGCPAVVVPVRVGAPLVAWDTLTLEQLWEVGLPPQKGQEDLREKGMRRLEGIVRVLMEYLELCVDWGRITVPEKTEQVDEEKVDEETKKDVLKSAVELLVAGAVKSKDSKEVREEVNKDRSGIVIFRIP